MVHSGMQGLWFHSHDSCSAPLVVAAGAVQGFTTGKAARVHAWSHAHVRAAARIALPGMGAGATCEPLQSSQRGVCCLTKQLVQLASCLIVPLERLESFAPLAQLARAWHAAVGEAASDCAGWK